MPEEPGKTNQEGASDEHHSPTAYRRGPHDHPERCLCPGRSTPPGSRCRRRGAGCRRCDARPCFAGSRGGRPAGEHDADDAACRYANDADDAADDGHDAGRHGARSYEARSYGARRHGAGHGSACKSEHAHDGDDAADDAHDAADDGHDAGRMAQGGMASGAPSGGAQNMPMGRACRTPARLTWVRCR